MGTIAKSADSVRPVMVQSEVGKTSGPAIHAASARPTMNQVPLRNPALEPGAPPPNMNHKNDKGDWKRVQKCYEDVKALCAELDGTSGGLKRNEQIIKLLGPEALKRLWIEIPEKDCLWPDSPISLGAWKHQIANLSFAFDPDPTLARSMGSQETREIPEIKAWAEQLAPWIFRFCPKAELPKKQKVNDLV